jgi:Flp pilus assembly protein TadG
MRAYPWKFAGRAAIISRLVPRVTAKHASLLQFVRDESGSYAITVAVAMPVIIGAVGLGTEASWWFYSQKNMLSAADSAAVSAATLRASTATGITIEGNSVAAAYGFVNGAGGATVTVNNPPASGAYKSAPHAVEVIITQTKNRLFSSVFSTGQVTLSARAVALLSNGANGCLLALDKTANPAVTVKGSAQVNLVNCSLYDDSNGVSALNVSGSATIAAATVNVVGGISGANSITTTNGKNTGVDPAIDPYANVTPPTPTGPKYNNKINVKNQTELSPGIYYGDISVNAGATLTLDPGTYYFDSSNLTVAGNATITGNNVTLVFTSTSSNWGSATLSSNANVTLTPPTTGSTAGIVMYGDRNMPTGTSFNLTGGGTQNLAGAIYLPKANLSFSGGDGTTTTCTQIIADTVTVVGNTNVKIDCSAFGTKSIGITTAQLVE